MEWKRGQPGFPPPPEGWLLGYSRHPGLLCLLGARNCPAPTPSPTLLPKPKGPEASAEAWPHPEVALQALDEGADSTMVQTPLNDLEKIISCSQFPQVHNGASVLN